MNFPFKTLICTIMNNKLVVVHRHGGNVYNDSIYCIVLYGNFRILLAVYETCCTQIIMFLDIVIHDDIVISRNISVVYDTQSFKSVILSVRSPCLSLVVCICVTPTIYEKSHVQKLFKMLPKNCGDTFSYQQWNNNNYTLNFYGYTKKIVRLYKKLN